MRANSVALPGDMVASWQSKLLVAGSRFGPYSKLRTALHGEEWTYKDYEGCLV
jgi:hypothetical protein